MPADRVETAFDNEFWDHWDVGIYVDATSGEPLFSSEEKCDAGTGWPSFLGTIAADIIKEINEREHGLIRIQLCSKTTNRHIGYLLLDGPEPTGLIYCIKSSALRFVPIADLP
ncbi:peptide-methionine (R)-S-oxide reductase MsrB [Roseovarius sp. EL26]|uniref:peptide-methionine (R)-S-oxide reductase MsrB n=1 Tax=Roseovarius sp. EL26 TaxID=2126672 RepID=UPI000EA24C7C|nr:peptide-methionine (R)-S-oxide reductase MsrB [Roseovarius sp. EL26]